MDEELLRAVKRLEAATDRTTYAVRALVRFVFIQLSATTVGTIALAIASFFHWAWLSVIAGSVTTIGLFWAGIAGRAELRKSNPKA